MSLSSLWPPKPLCLTTNILQSAMSKHPSRLAFWQDILADFLPVLQQSGTYHLEEGLQAPVLLVHALSAILIPTEIIQASERETSWAARGLYDKREWRVHMLPGGST
jgi:hypothetical protein